MNEFVEDCRREWRRLGVPERSANEMAADLAADLKEAEQNGVSAEEVLGEGAFDAHAFAASWASERGLVPDRQHDRLRDHRRMLVRATVALLAVAGVTLGAVLAFNHSGPRPAITDVGTARQPTQTIAPIAIPDVRHLRQEQAIAAAQSAGLQVEITIRTQKGVPAGTVLNQNPSPGTTVARGSTLALIIARSPKP
jgi:hypothetical protein